MQVERRAFMAAAKVAAAVIERRVHVPILATMRARANGALELSGTDLDTQVDVRIPYEGPQPSDFLIEDPRFLLHALGHAGGATVKLEPVDGRLAVSSGALSLVEPSECTASDWPQLFVGGFRQRFGATLSAEHLAQIGRIVTAMSTEETRYYLNGAYLHHLSGWTYRVAATDGHRLLCVDIELPDAEGEVGQGVIIPRRVIGLLLAHLGKAESIGLQIGSAAQENAVTTTAPEGDPTRTIWQADTAAGAVRIAAKLIDGRYPDYQRVIPAGSKFEVTLDVAELRAAAQAVSRPGDKLPALRLMFAGGRVTVARAMGDKSVSGTVSIDAAGAIDQGFAIGFNGCLLLQTLGALKGGEVVLGLENPAAPVLVRDPTDPALTGVLMPMRV